MNLGLPSGIWWVSLRQQVTRKAESNFPTGVAAGFDKLAIFGSMIVPSLQQWKVKCWCSVLAENVYGVDFNVACIES